MDIDDDDDFYSPDEPEVPAAEPEKPKAETANTAPKKDANEELEEGEEEDEGGAMDEDEDSDIDIVTERKDGSSSTAPSTSRYSEIKNIPQRTINSDAPPKPPPSAPQSHAQPPSQPQPAAPVSTSKVDVNAIPIHKPTGKPITQVNIDTDLADHAKPWRKPGTDQSDYFNYGFDEFTWALYAQKQEALRAEYNPEAIAASNKKMLEDMTNFMMMSGMPIPGAGPGPGGAGAGAGTGPFQGMPGMEGLPPEMQAMMQQMMTGGLDPSQMDMAAMAGMFGGAGPGGGGPGQGGQGQGFGGGFGGGQGGQGYGYDQQMAGGSGGGGGGGVGGGGRGGRGRGRRW
ncbi:hypothetical protein VTJ04DRAFT_4204 [Mycothermus thermophilus]|uniref:uncharacterized protein n=1 Tax=Humicola insolens TaxID=85995 RepID=UPI003743AF34